MMRPVKLKISGLHCFLEEQAIDFSRLTQAGLFGIFGPTGSGKSTILDAIILALYGKVPRSGGKPVGIVNSQSNTASVYYEFAIGQGTDRRTYSIQRVLKRTGTDGVNTEKAVLCDLTDLNNPQVIAEKASEVNAKVEEIIGLSAEDFTRSVVLPQGSFSEFLKLSGTARREMLERIFDLKKYGQEMADRIRRHKEKKHLELSELQGALQSYADVSEEGLEILSGEIGRLAGQREKLEKRWAKLEKEFAKFQAVYELQQELEKYREEERELAGKRAEIAAKEEILRKGEKAAALKPVIDRIETMQKNLRQKESELEAIGEELTATRSRLTETHTRFQEALHRKDAELPLLLGKQKDVERAVQILQEVEALEDERGKLRKAYKDIEGKLKEKKSALAELEKALEESGNLLQSVREKLAGIKTSPQEREMVSAACEAEREYNALLSQREEIRERIGAVEARLRKGRESHGKIQEMFKEKQNELAGLKKQRETLEQNCPGSREELRQREIEISILGRDIETLAEWVKDAQKIRADLTELEDKLNAADRNLKEVCETLEKKGKEIAETASLLQKSREKNMAGLLARSLRAGEPCPVCGSVHHPCAAGMADDEEIAELEQRLAKLEAEKQALQEKSVCLEMEVRGTAKEIGNKRAEYEKLSTKIGGRDVSSLQQHLAAMQAEFEQLTKKTVDWEAELETTDERIVRLKDELAVLMSQEASQAAECRKDEDSLRELGMQLKEMEKKIEGARSRYDGLRASLGLENPQERYRQIQKNDQETEKLENRQRKIVQEIEQQEKARGALQEEIVKLKTELAAIEQSGKEKAEFIRKKSEEAKNFSEGREPFAYLREIRQKISEVEGCYNMLAERYEKERKKQQELENEYAKAEGDRNTLKKLLADEEAEFGRNLAVFGFADKQEAEESFIPEEKINELKDLLRTYAQKVSMNAGNIRRIEDKLNGESISEAEWTALQESRNEVKGELEAIKSLLAVKEEKKKEMEGKLHILKGLQEKYRELEHKCGLLRELETLFQGKKFVEFIASSQLNYIAKEASRKLKSITRGRYALELNSEGEFVIRDDFEGGVRRPVHTLSGGETFVTSLSLALALSSHIQLGKASLEFFFLDEGFGTLDPETLEAVISSLEGLHTEKLSVGVISHVEELKQRMPKKLLVEPPVPGLYGTRVKFEES